MQPFRAPALPHEFDSQPIEQFWVSRTRSGLTEVSRRGDDALSEMMLPKSVDDDSCRQRMLGTGQPLGERESQTGRFALDVGRPNRVRFTRRTQDRQEPRRDLGAGEIDIASMQQPNRWSLTDVPQRLDFLNLQRREQPIVRGDFSLRVRQLFAIDFVECRVGFSVSHGERLGEFLGQVLLHFGAFLLVGCDGRFRVGANRFGKLQEFLFQQPLLGRLADFAKFIFQAGQLRRRVRALAIDFGLLGFRDVEQVPSIRRQPIRGVISRREDRQKSVVVRLWNRIELVAVTASTGQRHAHRARRNSFHQLEQCLVTIER